MLWAEEDSTRTRPTRRRVFSRVDHPNIRTSHWRSAAETFRRSTALARASEDASNASETRGRTGDGSNVPPTRPRRVHRFVVAGPRKMSCQVDESAIGQHKSERGSPEGGKVGGSRRTHAPVTPGRAIIVPHAAPPCVARLRGSRDPSLDAHGTSSARRSEWAPRQG
jgi:hypothetical protein